ncbi:heparan-alpha-glucosaminide N-acetyltransferase domain-containing protein, partial [Janthinobacterium sp.]
MTTLTPSSQRYLALDVLRGLTVALMIVVNTPGDWATVYAPFLHSDWHGFTLTDLVFPSFLFVVGNAMAFALGKYENLGHGAVLAKLFRRSALIFLLGFFLYWFPFFKIDAAGQFAWTPLS